MFVLIAVGFAAGLITALSPCVLPVLPILLAGGATGGRRKPYAIIVGLVASFTAFALALGADSRFQTAVPGYTESFQERIERSSAAERELGELTGRETRSEGL